MGQGLQELEKKKVRKNFKLKRTENSCYCTHIFENEQL